MQSGDIVPRILNLATRRVICQLHPSATLPSRKRPRYLWIGGWVGPRTGTDVVLMIILIFLPSVFPTVHILLAFIALEP
jgi:hypothetical protein